MAAYDCVICKRTIRFEPDGERLPSLYPFCSERCRTVDLGNWLSERYTVDRDLTPDDLTEIDRRPGDDYA